MRGRVGGGAGMECRGSGAACALELHLTVGAGMRAWNRAGDRLSCYTGKGVKSDLHLLPLEPTQLNWPCLSAAPLMHAPWAALCHTQGTSHTLSPRPGRRVAWERG